MYRITSAVCSPKVLCIVLTDSVGMLYCSTCMVCCPCLCEIHIHLRGRGSIRTRIDAIRKGSGASLLERTRLAHKLQRVSRELKLSRKRRGKNSPSTTATRDTMCHSRSVPSEFPCLHSTSGAAWTHTVGCSNLWRALSW